MQKTWRTNLASFSPILGIGVSHGEILPIGDTCNTPRSRFEQCSTILAQYLVLRDHLDRPPFLFVATSTRVSSAYADRLRTWAGSRLTLSAVQLNPKWRSYRHGAPHRHFGKNMSVTSPREKNSTKEDVSTTVTNFLMKRKYAESETSVQSINTERLEEMALSTSISNETGITNVFSFAANNNSNPSLFDEQYSNLKSFITGANQVYRTELSTLLFPMFANIYLELVVKCYSSAASGFFSKHSGDFMSEHKEEVQHLQGITCVERVGTSDVANAFRRRKYAVKLSKKVFSYFIQYLRSGQHTLLLQILNKSLHIEVTHSKPGRRISVEDEPDLEVSSTAPALNRVGGTAKHSSTDPVKDCEGLAALNASIEQIRNGPACIPSVSFYTFRNAYKG